MNDMNLIESLNETVVRISKERHKLHEFLCEMENHYNETNNLESKYILEGKVVGKNEKERNAALASLMADKQQTGLDFKQKVREQQIIVDNLNDKLKSLRLIARIITRENYKDE